MPLICKKILISVVCSFVLGFAPAWCGTCGEVYDGADFAGSCEYCGAPYARGDF